jgi:poly-gamma-glutamate synthesis protein (capsule biosynthesis protein)
VRRTGALILASLTLVVGVVLLTVDRDDDTDPGVGAPTATNRTAAPAATTAPPAPAASPGARSPRGNGKPVTFAFAGDTQFPDIFDTDPGVTSSGTHTLAEQLLADPAHVLDPIAPALSGADLTVVNLETAVTRGGAPVPGKNYHFRSPAESFDALKAAGVDVVAMANNHALDYGPEGMQDTFAAIADSGLPVIGIGHDAAEAYRPYRTVIRGQRIAILNALDWLEPGLIESWSATDTQAGVAFSIDPSRLLTELRAVRPEVDTVIVFLHWGTEETWCASPQQQEFATALLREGADIIVGSHAHRVFGAGRAGSGFVAYGLGNFVYFREDGESGRTGVLHVTATGREVDAYAWVPARITRGIPQPLSGAEAAADLAEWEARRSCSGLSP